MAHSKKTQALLDKALELRAQGMSYGKIGRKLDLSQQYVMVLLNPEKYNSPEAKQYRSEYGAKHRDKISANHKEWRAKNPTYYHDYYQKNKKKIQAYYKNKRLEAKKAKEQAKAMENEVTQGE